MGENVNKKLNSSFHHQMATMLSLLGRGFGEYKIMQNGGDNTLSTQLSKLI